MDMLLQIKVPFVETLYVKSKNWQYVNLKLRRMFGQSTFVYYLLNQAL